MLARKHPRQQHLHSDTCTHEVDTISNLLVICCLGSSTCMHLAKPITAYSQRPTSLTCCPSFSCRKSALNATLLLLLLLLLPAPDAKSSISSSALLSSPPAAAAAAAESAPSVSVSVGAAAALLQSDQAASQPGEDRELPEQRSSKPPQGLANSTDTWTKSAQHSTAQERTAYGVGGTVCGFCCCCFASVRSGSRGRIASCRSDGAADYHTGSRTQPTPAHTSPQHRAAQQRKAQHVV